MKQVMDETVTASGADMRELAFKNLEAVIAGWGRVAEMLDERHPLTQTVIGLNIMAERSLRAVSLVPMSALAAPSEPGTAIMKVEDEKPGEAAPDTRKPWAVAHARRKHYCIGRSDGCPYGTHGNSIGRHQNNCVHAANVRAKQAKAVLGDAVKLGVVDKDESKGKVVKLPAKKSRRSWKQGLSSDALKQFRKDGNVSRAKMAKLIGASAAKIRSWEVGNVVPSQADQTEIERVLSERSNAPVVKKSPGKKVKTRAKRRVAG